jgi:hypothetical protein
VTVTASLCREAGHLAERHRLRGFDSFHLASFVEILRTADDSVVEFSSFDAALNRGGRGSAPFLSAGKVAGPTGGDRPTIAPGAGPDSPSPKVALRRGRVSLRNTFPVRAAGAITGIRFGQGTPGVRAGLRSMM